MSRLNVGAVSAEFARNYLRSNPNATEQNLQVSLKEHLQGLKKNGAKISDKQIAQANASVGQLYKATVEQIKANSIVNVAPNATSAIQSLNIQQAKASYPKPKAHLAADHHYFEFNKMGKKARRSIHKENMHNARAAFGGDEYLNYLKEHNPKLYAEEIAAQAKPVSNTQNKKAVNAGYQSAKKNKLARKQAGVKRFKRKAKLQYKQRCTSQGIMTKPAKKQFNAISNQLDGQIHVTVNEKPNSILTKMKEFYQGLERANAPKIEVKPITVKPKASKPASTTIETVAQTAKKGKLGWIVGIGAGLAALAGIFATSKPEASKEVLNNVA